MKAIILAAGMGTRLGKHSNNLPKCMLNFNGKTLLERQVKVLRQAGINDIIIIKGYMKNKINIPGTKTYTNKDYKNTNMVETLMTAESEMDGGILVCYGDILYEPRIIKKILGTNVDIGVTADKHYLDYWKAKSNKWKEDMESFTVENGILKELGTPNPKIIPKYRYVGLIKFSKKGVKVLKKIYHKNKKIYYNRDEPWLNSKSFKKAYMTDMLQAIINAGYKVNPVIISRGWLEFDTWQDYVVYNGWLKSKSLERFFKF